MFKKKTHQFISLQIKTGFIVIAVLLIHHIALCELFNLSIRFVDFKIKVFIYGCPRSSLLHVGFLWLQRVEATL